MKKINGIKKSVKEEIEEFDERVRRQNQRKGPWEDSIKDLPPEEQDKVVAKRLLDDVDNFKPKEKTNGRKQRKPRKPRPIRRPTATARR